MKVKDLIIKLSEHNLEDKVEIYLRDDKIPLEEEGGYQLWSPKVTSHEGWKGLVTIELDELECIQLSLAAEGSWVDEGV